MKIGELAAEAGCDVQTVRYYEREGLLDAPERDGSGYRRYGAHHLARLQFVRHCRTLDIPLAEIRQLIALAQAPAPASHEADALLDEHIARVQRQLQALSALQDQLLALRRQCAGADDGQVCGILQAFMHAPAEHACACHPGSSEAAGTS